MLALESAADPTIAHPYPFDVLGAQSQGMIGYWLLQALQNAAPGRRAACLVSRTLAASRMPRSASRPSSSAGATTSSKCAGGGGIPVVKHGGMSRCAGPRRSSIRN
jgi:carbamate kinase